MSAKKSFSTLFRLYDLPEWSRAYARARDLGVEIRSLAYRDATGVTRLIEGYSDLSAALVPSILGREPIPAVVAHKAGEVVGLGLYDLRSPGTVGPIVHGDDELGRTLAPILLEHTLHRAAWHGYCYSVDSDLDASSYEHLLARACMSLADLDPRASVADRDIEDMPWGDIYVPTSVELASLMPQVSPYRGGEDGREFRIRQAMSSEYDLVTSWVAEEFGRGWASELKRGFTRTPISTIIAVLEEPDLAPKERLLGFVAYDCAWLGMGSTIAVHPKVGKWQHRLPIVMALAIHEFREQMARGFEYLIAGGITRRKTILGTVGWTIRGSYPGPFGRVINYK